MCKGVKLIKINTILYYNIKMSIELPKHFEYFERNTPNTIEKHIRKQGDDIWQNKIGTDFIKYRLKDYTFGFARISNKAKIGQQMKTRQTEQHTFSFILCRIVNDPYVREINISLVCSRPTSKDGILLMTLVENKAREMQFQKLSLIAVGNARLLHWYEALGFDCTDNKPILDCSSKAYSYSMRKYI